MRILQLVDNLEPYHTGGGYYQPIKQAEYLARSGHDLFVVAVNDLNWGEQVPGIKYFFRPHVFRSSVLRRKADRLIEEFSDRIILPLIVRRFRPDWIGGVLTFSAIKAHRLSRQFGLPLFNYVYETPPMIRENIGCSAFECLMTPHLSAIWERTREAYRASSVLFPNSEFSGRFCRKWLQGGNLAEPLFPGIDVKMRAGLGSRRSSCGTHSILSVGRLSKPKGLDVLIMALKRMSLGAELHIVGDGEERATLQELAAGMRNVRFHGFVEDETLWKLYNDCDVVAYPTSFEGFGMPPMQALFFGKPCIASDISVLKEIFGDHLDYFRCGDSGDLASTLDRVLGDTDYRARKGAEGHAFVVKRFSWERSARQMVLTLESSERSARVE